MTVADQLSQMRRRVEAVQKRFQLIRPDLDWAIVAKEANDRARVSLDHDALYFLEHWGQLVVSLKPLPFEAVSA